MFVDENNELKNVEFGKIDEISFENSHLVAEYLFTQDKKVAEALMLELEAQFRFGGKDGE